MWIPNFPNTICWMVIFHSFTLSLCLSFPIRCDSCRHQMLGSYFLIIPTNLCLFVGWGEVLGFDSWFCACKTGALPLALHLWSSLCLLFGEMKLLIFSYWKVCSNSCHFVVFLCCLILSQSSCENYSFLYFLGCVYLPFLCIGYFKCLLQC
jgi:hypothetical protein